MKTKNDHKAPWSKSLIIISSLVTVLSIGVAVVLTGDGRGPLNWLAFLPVATVCCGALFTIRGYAVTPDAILIRRLFWTTRLELANFQSAQVVPHAMRSSLRMFGNGGLFSFSGLFRNKALGTYRAFVTDPNRTVVLRFSTRNVVVSPASPEDFVNDISLEERVSGTNRRIVQNDFPNGIPGR